MGTYLDLDDAAAPHTVARLELAALRQQLAEATADAIEAWRRCHIAECEAKGPDGFATWKDAAVAMRQQLAEAQAKIAAHEAMMAGAVEAGVALLPEDDVNWWRWELSPEEYTALLPLDGETVLVVRKPT